MSLAAARFKFPDYLRNAVPEDYPIDGIPLSVHMQADRRKELIFQQSFFLQVSREHLQTKPWISYFAAAKHFLLLNELGISTASFSDLRDKEFFSKLDDSAYDLHDQARRLLEVDAISKLDRLSALQNHFKLIFPAREILNEIIGSPLRSIITIMPLNANPIGCRVAGLGCLGVLLLFGGFVAFCALVISNDPLPIILLGAILIALGLKFFWQLNMASEISEIQRKFFTHVVPVAEIFDVPRDAWWKQPESGIAYFDDLHSTRRQLEDFLFGDGNK